MPAYDADQAGLSPINGGVNKNLSFGRMHGKIESGTNNVDAEGVVDKKIGLFSSKIDASPSDGEITTSKIN
jgi:hypothetical protein